MLKIFNKLKKGFSIAEVVIAIAVISIISVSAVSTVTLSVKNQQKNLRNHDIAITCDTVINCFRYDNLTSLAEIYSESYENNSIDRGSYVLEIDIEYDEIDENKPIKITLTAKDLSGNQLHEVSYVK